MDSQASPKELFVFFRPFSVTRVKKERLIREIMVLRNEVKNFDWKGNDTGRDESNHALNESEKKAKKGNFEESWGHYLNADQFMVKSKPMKS